MRIAWLDNQDKPWTTHDAEEQLSRFGFEIIHCRSIHEAQAALGDDLSVFVVNHALEGALDFLGQIKETHSYLPTLLISSTWGKKEFRTHSQTSGAAHRYAKIPMPVLGFVDTCCALAGVDKSQLGVERGRLLGSARAPQPSNPDEVETLRKYLQMREEELVQTNSKLSELRRDYDRLQAELAEKAKEIRHKSQVCEEAERKERFALERAYEGEKQLVLERENHDLAIKAEREKFQELERELVETKDRHDSLKARVRKDLRRIRLREKDLESKLDLLRTDSYRMVEARDVKVLELQRKIDALEFDLDHLQDSRYKALSEAERYLIKLSKVSQALHRALDLIAEDAKEAPLAETMETFLGGAAEEEQQDSASTQGLVAQSETLAQSTPAQSGFASDSSTGVAQSSSSRDREEEDAGTADSLLASHESGSRLESAAAGGVDLEALANDGEATRIISASDVSESGSSNDESLGKLSITDDFEAVS